MKSYILLLYYFPIYILVKLWQSTRLVRSTIGLNDCRFYPSCSDYFLEAITKQGLFHGLFLWLKRIIRCHPFCKGGIDEINNKRNYGS